MRWRLMKVEESKVASRNPRQDRLSREQLMANFGITEATLAIDDDLFDLFQEAYENNWQGATGKALFDAKLKQTTWWQENSKYMRDYLIRSANPDMDWQMLVDDSEEAVRQEAMRLGVTLSDAEVDDFTQQSMMYGWYDEANKFKLRRAIEARPRTGGGDIGSLVEQLRAYSREMGVTYDQKWYDSAASSIATDRTDGEYWKDQIRKQSASMFPMFRDSIMAGQSMASIASPYRAMMEEEWDVPADSISVTDPIILRAMGGDGGNQMMNLADFQRMLRRDPRWMETDKAQNDITGIASGVLKMFGMTGG